MEEDVAVHSMGARTPRTAPPSGAPPDTRPGTWRLRIGLHAARIPAPAGVHGDVLLAADRERCGRRQNPRVGRILPQQFAVIGVEGTWM